MFESNTDLAIMREPFGKKFLKTYEIAMNEYVKGNCGPAEIGFNEVLVMKPGDGPCTRHMNHMKDNNMKPPADWLGYKANDE